MNLAMVCTVNQIDHRGGLKEVGFLTARCSCIQLGSKHKHYTFTLTYYSEDVYFDHYLPLSVKKLKALNRDEVITICLQLFYMYTVYINYMILYESCSTHTRRINAIVMV